MSGHGDGAREHAGAQALLRLAIAASCAVPAQTEVRNLCCPDLQLIRSSTSKKARHVSTDQSQDARCSEGSLGRG